MALFVFDRFDEFLECRFEVNFIGHQQLTRPRNAA